MVAQTQSQMGKSSSSTPLSVDDIHTQVINGLGEKWLCT